MNKLTPQLRINKGNSKECEFEVICDSKVYTKESNSGQLLDLYYLIS